MKKQLIATIVATGFLLGVPAAAFAQVGSTSFAFSGDETAQTSGGANGAPSYYDYVAPNSVQPANHGHAIHRSDFRR